MYPTDKRAEQTSFEGVKKLPSIFQEKVNPYLNIIKPAMQ